MPGGERASGRGVPPGRLILLWLILAALSAGAYLGLPRYMESLDRRIVFRQPDCMDIAREQAQSTAVGVAERADSLEAWIRSCLEERQAEMGRHADRIGYGTTGALITMSLLLTALSIRSARGRPG
ncbi:MAG: hypothetical protein ACPHQP_10935 [Longimicrobiales bacterium]